MAAWSTFAVRRASLLLRPSNGGEGRKRTVESTAASGAPGRSTRNGNSQRQYYSMNTDRRRIDSARVGDPKGRVLSRMGRRRFVRTLVDVGLGATVARALTPRGFLETGPGEVPTLYGRVRAGDQKNLERRTKPVPFEWYNELRRAFAVQHVVTLPGIPDISARCVLRLSAGALSEDSRRSTLTPLPPLAVRGHSDRGQVRDGPSRYTE